VSSLGPSVILQLLGKHHDDVAGTAEVGELVDVLIGRDATKWMASVLRRYLKGYVDVVDRERDAVHANVVGTSGLRLNRFGVDVLEEFKTTVTIRSLEHRNPGVVAIKANGGVGPFTTDRVTAHDRKAEVGEKGDRCFEVANRDANILKLDRHAFHATEVGRPPLGASPDPMQQTDVVKVTSEMIDPQLRARGRILRRLLANQSEARFRKQNPGMAIAEALTKRNLPRGVNYTTEWALRADGSKLRLLVARPLVPKDNVAGILWIHGGGYSTGTPEVEASVGRQLIGLSDCVVVSADYTLSRQAPFPAALDDCYLALVWMRDNATRLGIRLDQLAVAGGSAGGGLTAALTLYARDKREIAIAFQMPIYPMIDDRCATESARENDAPVWDGVSNRNAWKVYLGDLYGTEDVPIYAAPARATDYAGLPPTFTFVGSIEPFRDETIEYVDKLRAAGVPVDFKIFEGCFHGFDGLVPKARISLEAAQFRNTWFQHSIETYFAAQPASK
jgi:acetyl esterase/lipase